MENSLLNTVLLEIERREEREAFQKKERTKSFIIESFETALNECLAFFLDYRGHEFVIPTGEDLFYFHEIVKELGFDCKPTEDKDVYFFEVSHTPLTPAREKLNQFEKKLAHACEKRREELQAECEKVKRLLEKGEFNYRLAGARSPLAIFVESAKTANSSFEKNIIEEFFKPYAFSFKCVREDGNWMLILDT